MSSPVVTFCQVQELHFVKSRSYTLSSPGVTFCQVQELYFVKSSVYACSDLNFLNEC
uniref:Uncharacterized protein n=1 Tax=Microviridae sp. ctKRd3 TaxID=2827642 RepID=A0A8S5SMQ4_9VIRU|nr:MAG TPA: hypothetical protein [Microviridae sp. ctKRd3]